MRWRSAFLFGVAVAVAATVTSAICRFSLIERRRLRCVRELPRPTRESGVGSSPVPATASALSQVIGERTTSSRTESAADRGAGWERLVVDALTAGRLHCGRAGPRGIDAAATFVYSANPHRLVAARTAG